MMIGKAGHRIGGVQIFIRGGVYLMWLKLYSNSRVHFI